MHYVDHKFMLLVGNRLDQFEESNNRVYKCRCPFCGDSKKHLNKTRGFFIPTNDSYRFFCHNCGASFNLSMFLKDRAFDLFENYKLEKFGSIMNRTKDSKKDKELIIPNTTFFETDELLKKCVPIKKCSGSLGQIKDYIRYRKLPVELHDSLYATDNINKMTSVIPRYNGIAFPKCNMLVIPFFTSGKDYNFIQCRVADKSSNLSLKFVTLEIKSGPKLYGEDRINWSEKIYVLESPIDSMFIENSLAVAGSTASIKYIADTVNVNNGANENIVMLMDNDYRSNIQIRNRLIKSIGFGYSVVIYDKEFLGIKDINEAIVAHNWSRTDINQYIQDRTFWGLRASLELSFQMK